MLSTAVVMLGVGFIVALRLLVHRIALGPGRRSRGPSYQLATYHHGRVTHLTPVRDLVHAEDESGACRCRPHSGRYPMPDGPSGLFYVHRTLRRDRFTGLR